MVDCFSFVAMDEFGVKQALTFDEHFRQAGYRVPLLWGSLLGTMEIVKI